MNFNAVIKTIFLGKCIDWAESHDFYQDFDNSLPLFSSLLKKEGRRKDQAERHCFWPLVVEKQCLSTWSEEKVNE